jgi:hypothetical protein
MHSSFSFCFSLLFCTESSLPFLLPPMVLYLLYVFFLFFHVFFLVSIISTLHYGFNLLYTLNLSIYQASISVIISSNYVASASMSSFVYMVSRYLLSSNLSIWYVFAPSLFFFVYCLYFVSYSHFIYFFLLFICHYFYL